MIPMLGNTSQNAPLSVLVPLKKILWIPYLNRGYSVLYPYLTDAIHPSHLHFA
jgi:hypothetical protein